MMKSESMLLCLWAQPPPPQVTAAPVRLACCPVTRGTCSFLCPKPCPVPMSQPLTVEQRPWGLPGGGHVFFYCRTCPACKAQVQALQVTEETWPLRNLQSNWGDRSLPPRRQGNDLRGCLWASDRISKVVGLHIGVLWSFTHRSGGS